MSCACVELIQSRVSKALRMCLQSVTLPRPQTGPWLEHKLNSHKELRALSLSCALGPRWGWGTRKALKSKLIPGPEPTEHGLRLVV